MDIHMPRMNGYDASRILKKELHLETPIVAVTATSETKEVIEQNREIVAGYLEKPYSPGAFRVMFSNYGK